MLGTLPPEAAGLLALFALTLLPGLLVVRAPWTVVPALSVAFWTLSWWWLPLVGRFRILQATLLLFGLLALLRLLPRHTVPPPPGYTGPAPPPPVRGPTTGDVPKLRSAPSLLIVAVAIAMAVPWPLWPHAPGQEMAFHTTSARLAVWRDGPPASYEPLLPLTPFGAHAPALPTLAADVSLLTGLDPGRSVVAVAQLSAALLLLGFFAVLGTRLRPPSAALAALLGLATAPWPGFLTLWGEGGPVLALALGLSGATLFIGHSSRPSAVAAGMLLAGAILAQPLLALTIVLMLAVPVGSTVPGSTRPGGAEASSSAGGPSGDPGHGHRFLVVLGVAAVLAAPALVRVGRALSAREAGAVLRSPRAEEIAQFVTGLALLALAVLLAHLLGQPRLRPGVLAVALFGVCAAFLLVSVHAAPAPGQLAPDRLRTLARLAEEARPLQAVCAPPGLVDWVPALAGRPAGSSRTSRAQPWVPHVFRDELRLASPPPCTKRLDPAPMTSFDERGGTAPKRSP